MCVSVCVMCVLCVCVCVVRNSYQILKVDVNFYLIINNTQSVKHIFLGKNIYWLFT